MFGLDGFELDGDLFARDDVHAEIDVTWRVKDEMSQCSRDGCGCLKRRTKTARTDFLPESVLSSNAKVHFARRGWFGRDC